MMLALIDFNFTAMFDFLFKKRASAKLALLIQLQAEQQHQAEAAVAAAKFVDKQAQKQAQLIAAGKLAGQEAAALAFILQSDYADARFQAVQHIHEAAALAQIIQAMRNTDRRVSKYAQEQLTALQTQQKRAALAEACLLQGQQLLANPVLMVNQLAEWDKSCSALGEPDARLLSIKAELESRLQQQLALQRRFLQLTIHLHDLSASNLNDAAAVQSAQIQLAEFEQEFLAIQADPLQASLPKNYATQLATDISAVQAHLQQQSSIASKLLARSEALANWSTATQPGLDTVRKQWKNLAITDAKLSQDQHQLIFQQELEFNQLIATLARTAAISNSNSSPAVQAADSSISPETPSADVHATLAGMEAALEQGSLQLALDFEKTLRQLSVPTAIAARVSMARAELNRLLDWAKWGGNVSREELVKVADELMLSELAPAELAKQVGGLRARWKELDRTSGPSAKPVWERFDLACNRAYEIADAHFKQQAQLRQANLLAAQAQLLAMDELIAQLPGQGVDWKSQLAMLTLLKLEWRKLGAIDRKHKSRLDAEFAAKLAILEQPLTEARNAAMRIREQLISAVSAIDANQRDAAELVQQAQQRWQQQALSLPLERQDEQKLWKQFRAACDTVFEQRKANMDEQKQRRQQSQQAQQLCCEKLELCLSQEADAASLNTQLRLAKQEWRELSGSQRQAAASGLDARFDAAVHAVEQRLAILAAAVKQRELALLLEKMQLCQLVERSYAADSADHEAQVVQWQQQWDRLAKLPAELNKLLTQRFQQGLAQAETSPVVAGQALLLEQSLEQSLLRLEMLSGLPSPAELMQQRLQLQVSDLQSLMKNRNAQANVDMHLQALCALPVALTEQQQQRFQQILRKLN